MKIVHAAAKTSDAIRLCPIFIEGQIVAKLESFATESHVLFTDA
jgi:hypothetical protein